MKITLEYQDIETKETTRKIICETDSENIYDVLQDIKGALVVYGFHPESVKDGFLQLNLKEEADENS